MTTTIRYTDVHQGMNSGELGWLRCLKCREPIERVEIEEHPDSWEVTAFCHDEGETMIIPVETMRLFAIEHPGMPPILCATQWRAGYAFFRYRTPIFFHVSWGPLTPEPTHDEAVYVKQVVERVVDACRASKTTWTAEQLNRELTYNAQEPSRFGIEFRINIDGEIIAHVAVKASRLPLPNLAIPSLPNLTDFQAQLSEEYHDRRLREAVDLLDRFMRSALRAWCANPSLLEFD